MRQVILFLLFGLLSSHVAAFGPGKSCKRSMDMVKKIDDLFVHAKQQRFSSGHTPLIKTLRLDASIPSSVSLSLHARKHQIVTVVIDAGHGGRDSGARGINGIEEKTVVLDIAKKLVKEMNREPNVRAFLTRQGDYFISLRKRLSLAHQYNADAFIAIHADAYFDITAHGVSVYALSQRGATNEAARWLAMRDNYVELGEVELNELKDRSSALRSMLIDLAQTATITGQFTARE